MENPPPVEALPPGFAPESDFETDLRFPTLLAFGYGVWVTETLRLEANVEWLEHSRNNAVRVDIGGNNVLLEEAVGSTSLPQDWDDTWSVGLGADWRVAPCWILRGGWTWLPTPVPEETLMPVLPDAERHILGFGVGFRKKAHSVDLAYNLSIDKEQDTRGTGNPVQGTFDWKPHLWGVNYGYRF